MISRVCLARRDLSATEVARMRVTYGLLKEHVQALEQNLDGVDAETNPLIDPRSVRKVLLFSWRLAMLNLSAADLLAEYV